LYPLHLPAGQPDTQTLALNSVEEESRLIHIEYRYPWARIGWSRFGSAADLPLAIELLDVCRLDNPGSECRIRSEGSLPGNFIHLA
jgi:hypothetical protein